MKRIGSVHGSLTDQTVDTNFSLLLSAKDCVAEDLKDQPGALGAREEALLVFTAEELVQLVQSEGSRVVVRREVGHSLVHQVGQTQRGQEAGRPVPAWGRLGLDWCPEIELHCHVTDDCPGGVQLDKVETSLALVLIFLQTNLHKVKVKERRNISHILHLQTFRLKT